MIIEGVDLMRAIDIYTGRLLWEAKLPGVGYFYNNLYHQPGANGAGNYSFSRPLRSAAMVVQSPWRGCACSGARWRSTWPKDSPQALSFLLA